MFNVFTRANYLNAGVTQARLASALECCVRVLRPGVYEVLAECSAADHTWASAFVSQPGLLEKRRVLAAASRSRELERAALIGALLTGKAVREKDVISHTTAARIWGLPIVDASSGTGSGKLRDHQDRRDRSPCLPLPVEMTCPDRSESTRYLHRYLRRLPPNEVRLFVPQELGDAAHAGVRVTSLQRTVVDVLRECDPATAFVVLEAYLAHVIPGPGLSGGTGRAGRVEGFHGFDEGVWNLYRPKEFICSDQAAVPVSWSLDVLPAVVRRARWNAVKELLDSAGTVKNSRFARQLLQWAHGLSGSPLEAVILLVLRQEGVDGVVQQHTFVDSTGLRSERVDFWLRHHDLVLAADGRGKYGASWDPQAQSFSREKAKQNALARHVGRVVRVTWDDVADPGRTGLRRILRANGVIR